MTHGIIPARPASYDKKVGLVLQGGGALASYQAGVYEALSSSGYTPDWVAAISIGATNAAIIAGNALKDRVHRLRSFWEAITAPTMFWPNAIGALVNVSGFHVDPGYRGQLTFAVFNAGPVPIHLKRGQPIFLIWYASLDRESAFKKNDPVHLGIDTELISGIAGELQSFAGLSKKMKDVDKALGDRIHAVEKEQTYYRVIGAIALALMIALTVNWLKDGFPVPSASPRASAGPPQSAPPP
jgi:hypothetical protein